MYITLWHQKMRHKGPITQRFMNYDKEYMHQILASAWTDVNDVLIIVFFLELVVSSVLISSLLYTSKL